MLDKKQSKLVSEEVFPQAAADQKVQEMLDFYKKYKEIADITEKIDIAMGRKTVYKCVSSSTENCEINYHGISSTTKPYKV